jgi:hypothetical protein
MAQPMELPIWNINRILFSHVCIFSPLMAKLAGSPPPMWPDGSVDPANQEE